MIWTLLKNRLRTFRDDDRGTIMVEAVMTLPLMFLGLALTYEFFEIHRFKSARIKATYTIADLISRENDVVTEIYMDNAKTLFDQMTNDYGDNQIRVSVVRYKAENDEYVVSWSEVRGTSGTFVPLVDQDVTNAHDTLPILQDGEEVIVVESVATYNTIFEVGLDPNLPIETRVFTSIRFAPQVCFEACAAI